MSSQLPTDRKEKRRRNGGSSHLFPLPLFFRQQRPAPVSRDTNSPATSSRRVQQRLSHMRVLVVLVNLVLCINNALYLDMKSCEYVKCLSQFGASYHSWYDQPMKVSTVEKQCICFGNYKNFVYHTHVCECVCLSCVYSLPGLSFYMSFVPTRAQQRLLLYVIDMCRHMLSMLQPNSNSQLVVAAITHSKHHVSVGVSDADVDGMESSECQANVWMIRRLFNFAQLFMNNKLYWSLSSVHHVGNGASDVYNSPLLSLLTQQSYADTASIMPLVAARVSLPKERVRGIPLMSLLPKQWREYYDDINARMRDEVERLMLDHVSPLQPPRVGGSRTEYISLLRRLMELDMLDFTMTPLCVNGVFTVAKDADSDRLIIDAQPANRVWCEPPHVQLPNPSHLIRLCVPTHMSAQSNHKKGAHQHSSGEHTMCVAKSDLSNYYHQLRLPEHWRPFFCLPPLSLSECRELGVSDRLLQSSTDSTDAVLYPMNSTLPMGFSHAVVIAQIIHEHVLYGEQDENDMDSNANGVNVQKQCTQPPRMRRVDNVLNLSLPWIDRVLHVIYIDDLVLICLQSHYNMCCAILEYVLECYARVGFPVNRKKLIKPTSALVAVIGIMIDGTRCCCMVSVEVCIELLQCTLNVLSMCAHSQHVLLHVLESLVGRWTWCVMIRRPVLAVLKYTYRFIAWMRAMKFKSALMWLSVQRELYALCCMLPLLHHSFLTSFHPYVYATDASSLGGGVCAADMLPGSTLSLLWPFTGHKHNSVLEQAVEWRRSQHNTDQYGDDEMADWSDEKMNTQLSSYVELSQLHDAITALKWRDIISHRWRYVQCDINQKELEAIILFIRHHLTLPSALVHSSVLFVLDSAVNYYNVLKGRCSSNTLLRIQRRLTVHLLCSGVNLLPIWLPTQWNPADEPSRAMAASSEMEQWCESTVSKAQDYQQIKREERNIMESMENAMEREWYENGTAGWLEL